MIKKVTLLQVLINNEVPRVAELFDEYKAAMVYHVIKIQEVSLRLYPEIYLYTKYIPAR